MAAAQRAVKAVVGVERDQARACPAGMPSVLLGEVALGLGVDEDGVHLPVRAQQGEEEPLLARGQPVADGDVAGAAAARS